MTTKRLTEDDYYVNYDYDVTNNSEETIDINPDSLILPNSETKHDFDSLPNIELPDDSLADIDLHDHDLIDNLMYVYYGSEGKNSNNYGMEIIIVGSVLSCAAQLLTILFLMLKENRKRKCRYRITFLHLMLSLCFSNLFFMMGVFVSTSRYTYLTKYAINCIRQNIFFCVL